MALVCPLRGVALRVVAAAGLVLAVGSAPPASSQVSPNGPEFQVNTYTTNHQDFPAVAADALGNFVVVWDSDVSGGTDTSSRSIQARRYAANGTALGPEFQVNTYTTAGQSLPAVAARSQGSFVVVWESYGSSGSDTSGKSIQAQRYDTSGTPVGGQFQVNTFTMASQFSPRVAVDGQGNFIVAWFSNLSDGTDTSYASIQAQRYDENGLPLGGQFQVNTYTSGSQFQPSVAADPQGNFVVVWVSEGSSGTDTSSFSVLGQRFDSSGLPLDGEFQANTFTTSHQLFPSVAVDGLGNFVVVWASHGSNGTDTSYDSIQAQRFEAGGLPLGEQFQVNTYTTNEQFAPAVNADGRGNFVVVWQSAASSGTDTSYSIQARQFDPSGTPLGAQFQVNTYTTSYQWYPAVAVDGRTNFVVAWGSLGSSGTDANGFSVQAQLYDGLFRDGFEGGNTSRWTQTVP